jgi:hypothetical protein
VVQDGSYFWVYDFDELDEIRMTADLMIAASGSPRHLSQAAIDLALGLGAVRPGSTRQRDRTSTTGGRPRPGPSGHAGPLRPV